MHLNSRRPALALRSRSLAAATVLAAGLSAGCTQDPVAERGGDSPEGVQADSACAHSICTTGTKLSKSCDPCVTKVCTADPYCCRTKWNAQCVGEVTSLCGQSCSGAPDLSQGHPDMSQGHPDMSQGHPDLSGGGGGVGPSGGSVDHLFFAVSGDSRAPSLDDTGGYPTAIIQKIYQDIEDMNPRPQFALATGDYQYASVTGNQGAAQLALYGQARQAYSGVLFAAMGNHECDGYTADNCTAPTNNYNAYANTLLKPIGKSLPYYSIPINAIDGSWTAKVLVLACNYWSSTQQSWLASALSQKTTYTFLVRHEPASATTGPCVSAVEGLMASHPYNLSLVGHTHHYEVDGKQIIVGNGGAPLSGGVYGYATVEQTSAGFVVTNYDYSTGAAVGSVTVPF